MFANITIFICILVFLIINHLEVIENILTSIMVIPLIVIYNFILLESSIPYAFIPSLIIFWLMEKPYLPDKIDRNA